MAGILDKIKGMFGGAKSKVDGAVDKVGEHVPDKVKETYEKVSDKIEDIMPGGDDEGEAEGDDATG